MICCAGQYRANGECETCDKSSTIAFLVLRIVGFVAATLYVSSKAHHQQQMVRIKVLSNFFQVSELTTMVRIPWPDFVKWTLPLNLPSADTSYLSTIGWNIMYYFYSVRYIPLFTFFAIGVKFHNAPKRSLKREELVQMLVFLLTMWYSPLFQAVSSVNKCFKDPDRCDAMFYKEDPTILCEGGIVTITVAHQWSLAVLVGAGFPFFIIVTTLRLKRRHALTAESSYSPLFQWYSPSAPFFEAVVMARKGLLILFTTDARRIRWSAANQAWSLLIMNALYLAILRTKQMRFFRSTTIEGWNLYLFDEVASSTVALIGNCLAVCGVYFGDEVEIFGIVFGVLNILFSIVFVIFYQVDIKRGKKSLKLQAKEFSLDPSLVEGVAAPVKKALEKFSIMMEMIETEKQEALRTEMFLEVPFLHSNVLNEIRREVGMDEREK